MTIGIFSNGRPLAAQLVARICARQAGGAILYDFSQPVDLCLDGQRLRWNGVEMTNLDQALIQGFPYCNPVIPDPAADRDWGVWQFDYLTKQQEFSSFYSFFQELERRGMPVHNAPQLQMLGFMKFGWLQRLRRAGIPVVPMLCTNDPVVAERQRSEWTDGVLWRPATGKATWQRFTQRQQEALVHPKKPPIMLAPILPGQIMRVFLYGGTPLLAVWHRFPENPPRRETLERFHVVDPVPYGEIWGQLGANIGAHWVMVLGVVNDQGFYIYDVDTDPAPDWLPSTLLLPLLDRLAEAMGQPISAARASIPDDIWLERPGIFLRRMMAILFQFEESKYRPPQ